MWMYASIPQRMTIGAIIQGAGVTGEMSPVRITLRANDSSFDSINIIAGSLETLVQNIISRNYTVVYIKKYRIAQAYFGR